MRIKKLLLRMFRQLLLAVFGESPSAKALGLRGIPAFIGISRTMQDFEAWDNDEWLHLAWQPFVCVWLLVWDILSYTANKTFNIFREMISSIR